MDNKSQIIEHLLEKFPYVRYAAIYADNVLFSKQRDQLPNTSSAESDRFEEMVVNPSLLTLARQRGKIDCGGLDFIMIGYGNFYQVIKEIENGHISICLEKGTDLAVRLKEILDYKL